MSSDFECPVCLEGNAEEQALPCKHVFCHVCVRRLALNCAPRCPLCRQDFQPADLQWTTAPLALNLALRSIGRLMSQEELEIAEKVEQQELLLRRRQGQTSLEEQVAELQRAGIPGPFARAVAGKVVISGRWRTSKWVQCDNREHVFVAQVLTSVLEFCKLADALGWTFDFADGSTYVHNPPLLRYRPSPGEDVQLYGLVNAEDPLAVPNSIFPNQESWWVLRKDGGAA